MYRHSLLLMSMFLMLCVSDVSAATRDELVSVVTAHYRLTVPGFFGELKEVGSVLTPRAAGLKAGRPSKLLQANQIRNGHLVVSGGSDLSLGGAHDGGVKVGERLYLYGVKPGPDYLELELYTVAGYVIPGVRGATPLQVSVRFLYDGGLAGVSPRQLLDDIKGWFQVEGGQQQNYGGPDSGRVTRTVLLGQSRDDVLVILGAPERQVLLDRKTVLVYPRLKIILLDGKVVDAE